MEPIERTPLGSSDFRADTILVGGGIVAKGDVFADAALGNDRPAKARVENRGRVEEWLEEYVAVLLSAARAADMSLREPQHGYGHLCPAGIRQNSAIGSRLRHSERHTWTGECAPDAHAAYARVDILPHLCHSNR